MKYLIFMFLVISCSSRPLQLTEKAKNLEIYPTKPTDCRVAGRVVGTHKEGSKELALNDALNQASDLKATGVFINQEVPNGNVMNIYATAYQCD